MTVALVTGATGFTGSHLVRRLLAASYTVHVVVRPASDLEPLASVRDQLVVHVHDGSTAHLTAILQAAAPAVVFHLAALVLTGHTPATLVPLLESNLVFATQLVEAMVSAGVSQLINTGSYWQHYEGQDYNPVNLYAATKQAFEAILQYYLEAAELKAITLVLFDSYGPADPRPKLFNLLAQAARTGEVLALTPGEQLLDLVHVEDVAEAFLCAHRYLRTLELHAHERYAVTSGRHLTLKEVVAIYERESGLRLLVRWGGRAYREREVMIPWSGGRALPGWQPQIRLEEGIGKLSEH